MANLIIEALLVGLFTGVVGLVISTLFMYISSKDLGVRIWSSVFFSFFLTGFLIHIIFELLGFNKKFCCQIGRYECGGI